VNNLPERRARHDAVRWPVIAGLTASVTTALTFGALSFFGGFGGAVLAPGQSGPGDPGGGAPPAGAPNAPTTIATVYRTQGDSLWIDLGTYVGSGGDAQDSAYILVDTSGGNFSAPQYFGDTLGAIQRDSIAADSGAVVDIVTGYKGTSGGWSAPDTLLGVEMTVSGLHPNEPAGFVTVWNNPGTFDSLPRRAGGGQPGWFDVSSYEANAEVVADAGNPTGSGFSVKFTHRTSGGGWGGKLNRFTGLGSNFGGVGYVGGGLEQQYIMFRLYIPTAGLSPCQGELNGIKLNYYGVEPTAKIGEGANEFYSATCSGGDLWAVQHGGLPGPDPHQFYITGAGYAFPPAFDTEWTVEYWRQAESANGAGDGELRIWVNGTEVNDSPWGGLDWSDPNFSGRLLDGFEMYHSQYAADNEHYWYQRELYISGCEPGSC
jgi:hypothetical protein